MTTDKFPESQQNHFLKEENDKAHGTLTPGQGTVSPGTELLSH